MIEFGNLLDKVIRASKTKELKESLNAYCAMIRLRNALRVKYNDRGIPLTSLSDDDYGKGIDHNYKEDTLPLVWKMIVEQKERIIELMGLSDIARQTDFYDIIYMYGREKISYERFIKLIITEIFEYFYYKRELPISIQKIETDHNSFIISFDSTIKST